MSGGDAPGLDSLEPRALWSVFFDICRIPHPSRQETALGDWVLDRARAAGIECLRDAVGNVILRSPARPGREGRRGFILQAHLDMVPQANSGSRHDFSRDPIRPRLEGADPGWLRATGTTLGADDGIGVAAAIALIEDGSLDRGSLECLFTVNEEAGMDGARGLEPGLLSGDLLLNLDGEDEDELCVGSAGGCRLIADFPVSPGPAPEGLAWLEVSVSGLRGGHSGGDIHLGRGNAIVVLARVLDAAGRTSGAPWRLARLQGGSVPNAIPREARALVGLGRDQVEPWRRAAEEAAERIAAGLAEADPGMAFAARATAGGAPATAFAAGAGKRLVSAIAGLPDGVRDMSPELPGLVVCSSNLGVAGPAESGEGSLELRILARAAVDAERDAYLDELERYLQPAGFACRRLEPNAAWAPDLGSPLLGLARVVYAECHGRQPSLRATHGGLECGLFRGAYPAWDMLSIGPSIRFPHSPDEAINVESVGRFWNFLRALVARGAPASRAAG